MKLTFATASQTAQMIREGQVSAVEVLDAYLQQIEQHNLTLNAIATLDIEAARTRAAEADAAQARGENWGALHGVPITIKDALATKNLRTTCNTKSLANYISQQDAIAVSRLRAAGAIIMAKTNCAPLAGDYQTDGVVWGRASNPWNLNYTPGGSTGGGAAAVAAGLSPLELGSDGGGSIRQPAHCCGIFGLKPTDRLVPTLGHLPELPDYPQSIRHVLTIGALARCVEDLQLCLSIIAGIDPRQPEIPPVTLKPPSQKPLSSLRIAWTPELGNLAVDREIELALTRAVKQLTDAGCQVEQRQPLGFDCALAWQAYGASYGQELLAAQPAITWENMLQALRITYYQTRVHQDYRDSPLEKSLLRAFPFNFPKYMGALTLRDRLIAVLDNFLRDWDAYLCPVSTITAFPHQPQGQPIKVNQIKLPYLTACGGYTILFNLTGHPVVVILNPITKIHLLRRVQLF
ncbi:MAG: amidase [Cyanobacteria bacterium J06621_8]